MVGKIFKSVLAVPAVVMLIISAVYGWLISGFILLGLSALWFIVETLKSYKTNGLFAFIPVIACAILSFAVWFPIAFVGLEIGVASAFFVVGAIADVIALAYVWGK